MSKKTDIKVCRYCNCPFGKQIDIAVDEYKLVGKTMYYHAECYKRKQKEENKDDKTKADLQYIKNGWVEHISNTVIYSQLFQCLNDLLSRGIPSDYLVFTFDYVVKHKMNLKYPLGFKYYVDKEEIKVAYRKHQLLKSVTKKPNEFKAKDTLDTPTFKINTKPVGFTSILGGNK